MPARALTINKAIDEKGNKRDVRRVRIGIRTNRPARLVTLVRVRHGKGGQAIVRMRERVVVL